MFDTIFKRTSYRGLYKDFPVPREDLTLILKAGLAAPSGCNKQSTSLIAIDDKEILKIIGELLNRKNIVSAPALILVLSQKIIANGGRCYYKQDFSAAVQNMLLAICELGYESCWLEGYVADNAESCAKITKLLGAPEDYELSVILPVGMADEELTYANKKSFEERAWFNGFRNS
ncbi:MAG: nitroreductase [Christensenellaceae bacterium]|nr:nitroreductase [Christensenellaceae bacterium]